MLSERNLKTGKSVFLFCFVQTELYYTCNSSVKSNWLPKMSRSLIIINSKCRSRGAPDPHERWLLSRKSWILKRRDVSDFRRFKISCSKVTVRERSVVLCSPKACPSTLVSYLVITGHFVVFRKRTSQLTSTPFVNGRKLPSLPELHLLFMANSPSQLSSN